MSNTVFLSWQADTPTIVGRNFIERALERVVSRIGEDTAIEAAVRELTVDRDTKGVAGSPPIVDTIFRKIDAAAVFVPDFTFVGTRRDGRPTPNPNVLIEYGWALKSLSHGRIVPVMNTAFGMPTAENMPFNLRHLRNPILFECSLNADDTTRQMVRENLAKELEVSIRTVLESEEFKKTQPKAIERPEFIGREPQDGPGKFRIRNEALGISEGFLQNTVEVRLTDGPVIWFRLAPSVSTGRVWSIATLKNTATQSPFLRPIGGGWTSFGYLRAADGFGIHVFIPNQPELTPLVVFAFINGEVWSIDSWLLDVLAQSGRKVIPINDRFYRSLEEYSNFLLKLGVEPPFRWIAGIEDTKGGILMPETGIVAALRGMTGTCVADVITETGLHTPGEDPKKSLRPFFVKLFDSCGLEFPGG